MEVDRENNILLGKIYHIMQKPCLYIKLDNQTFMKNDQDEYKRILSLTKN
jgi:hypothetical protein